MSREYAFQLAAELLDSIGLLWWASDGTALGCVRDGMLIESDKDIDIGVWVSDTPTARDVLAKAWSVTRDLPGQVQLGDGERIKIDVHGHTREGDEVSFPLGHHSVGNTTFHYVFPAHLFDDFDLYPMCGRLVYVPSPAEEYLEAHYGPDWRTPRAEWHYGKHPPCVRLP